MARSVYQHWVGEVSAKVGKFPAVARRVDQWFPEEKPVGATRIGSTTYPVPVDLFADLIHLEGKIGPVKFHLKLALAFTGTVEHWSAPDPVAGE
jgi:hypothetical protein